MVTDIPQFPAVELSDLKAYVKALRVDQAMEEYEVESSHVTLSVDWQNILSVMPDLSACLHLFHTFSM